MKLTLDQTQFIQENRQWLRQQRIDHAWFMLTSTEEKNGQKFWQLVIDMNTNK